MLRRAGTAEASHLPCTHSALPHPRATSGIRSTIQLKGWAQSKRLPFSQAAKAKHYSSCAALLGLALVQEDLLDTTSQTLNYGTNWLRGASLISIFKFLVWRAKGKKKQPRKNKSRKEKTHSFSLQSLPSGHKQSIIIALFCDFHPASIAVKQISTT